MRRNDLSVIPSLFFIRFSHLPVPPAAPRRNRCFASVPEGSAFGCRQPWLTARRAVAGESGAFAAKSFALCPPWLHGAAAEGGRAGIIEENSMVKYIICKKMFFFEGTYFKIRLYICKA